VIQVDITHDEQDRPAVKDLAEYLRTLGCGGWTRKVVAVKPLRVTDTTRIDKT
jgi:hypothetical protein